MRGLPLIRTLPRIPKGPRSIQRIRAAIQTGGPGEPPAGFLNGQNSRVEWIAYWALSRIYGNPPDPRLGPFVGGRPDWAYQTPVMGSYLRQLNSAVVDFLIDGECKPTAIRIQTEYFHLLADASQQARDRTQRLDLEKYGPVVDVYDYELVGENDSETAEKAIVTMKGAIGRIERADPILAGQVRRRYS